MNEAAAVADCEIGDETAALPVFDRWLHATVDDEDVVDEESGLLGHHVHTIRDMAALGADIVRVPRLT